jgi:hypothetical protein
MLYLWTGRQSPKRGHLPNTYTVNFDINTANINVDFWLATLAAFRPLRIGSCLS